MFPNTSTNAIVPVEPVMQLPFEPERQETLRELMPYFSAMAKSNSAVHLGALEKYHDEMGGSFAGSVIFRQDELRRSTFTEPFS